MNIGKGLSLFTIFVYTIIANIFGTLLKIHWIHILNSLILVNILYHLLEWKYDWVEQKDTNE